MESRKRGKMIEAQTFLKTKEVDTTSRWYAIHTKYKCEKHVVKSLQSKGIQAYTPTITNTKQYKRKVVTRNIPLINCYAFVNIQDKQYVKVLQTEYVYSFLKIGKEMNPVKQEEIDLLKRITGEFNNIELQESEYQEGMEVEVISGNLTGVKGILLEKKGKHNFVVELHSLSYQLKINVDPNQLRPLRRMEEILD